MLKLTRPIAFFDLEATGLDLASDRIVEVSVLKILPDGTKESYTQRVNPTIPIPAQASAIHGILDEDVKDMPTFADIAQDLLAFIDNCDMAGFNSNYYDVPLLNEEFLRLEISFKDAKRRFIDVYRIFQKQEPRNLTAAYKFYCDKNLENAHSAEADVLATYEVLLGQLEKYGDAIGTNVAELEAFSATDHNFVDAGRRMVNDKGVVKFNFGKFKGQAVEDVLTREPQYYNWIMKNNFLLDTKQKLKEIRLAMKFKS